MTPTSMIFRILPVWFSSQVRIFNAFLNKSQLIITLQDGKASLIDQALELLTNPAEEYSKEQKLSCKYADELPQMKFFYEGNQVRIHFLVITFSETFKLSHSLCVIS